MQNRTSPYVSIVLPCRNEADQIEACLKSILNQELPDGGLEVLVADGMSTDGTREYLQ
jgi:glycosyltransferase involved in cell wall biosynthesis